MLKRILDEKFDLETIQILEHKREHNLLLNRLKAYFKKEK
jgi:hypothetical protein